LTASSLARSAATKRSRSKGRLVARAAFVSETVRDEPFIEKAFRSRHVVLQEMLDDH
jgi:hypothetical protein